MVPPGPRGYIDGTRPYFRSVGQSAGPIRSNPLIPKRAASRQASSRLVPRAKTPVVTPCLMRPFRATGVTDCGRASPEGGNARARDAAVAEKRKSLRFTRSSYGEVHTLVMMAVIAVRVPARSRLGG